MFFSPEKALKTKVDKKGFKNNYENDSRFRKFVNSTAAIAHLPEEDIEEALKNIEDDFTFEEDKVEEFKRYFVKYIKDVWLNGCYPPSTWNCFSRSEDATNNNQVSQDNSKIRFKPPHRDRAHRHRANFICFLN